MAFDENLASRVNELLASRKDVETRKMFGGLCFMVNGRMACGVHNQDLIVKFDRERHAELAAKPGARPFDFTGRPMSGILYVGPAGFKTAAALKAWVEAGVANALAQPAKSARRKSKKTATRPKFGKLPDP
jgi:TfoX/Sxy family transcriptional regulator of competence genes